MENGTQQTRARKPATAGVQAAERAAKRAERVKPLAPVLLGAVYPLLLFQNVTGLSPWALRQAKRNGLRVVKVGKRHFVRGADWDEYLARQEHTA